MYDNKFETKENILWYDQGLIFDHVTLYCVFNLKTCAHIKHLSVKIRTIFKYFLPYNYKFSYHS